MHTHESATRELLRVSDQLLTDLHLWLQEHAGTDAGWRLLPGPGDSGEADPLDQVSVVLAFLTRGHQLFESICLLTAKGMAVQAQVIARALRESAIDLRYIATEPPRLASRYVQYEDAARYRAYLGALDEDLDPEPPADIATLRSRYDGSAVPKKWDPSTVETRAQAGDRLFDGDDTTYKVYRQLCIATHGDASSIKDYVVVDSGGPHLRVGPSWHKAVWVQLHALFDMSSLIRAAERIGAPIDPEKFNYEMQIERNTLVQLSARGWAVERKD